MRRTVTATICEQFILHAQPPYGNKVTTKKQKNIIAVILVIVLLIALWNEYIVIDLMHITLQPTSETFRSVSQIKRLDDAVNSATGTSFMGEKIRTFRGKRYFTNFSNNIQQKRNNVPTPSTAITCEKWNVVTTIYAPSDAVKRAANVTGWCTVIVADTKTPKDYVLQAGLVGMEPTVRYLSVQDQKNWLDRENENGKISAVGKFLKAIPYKHFSRKNIGYLYAVLHGAKIIFDFDDDNLLPVDNVTGTVIPPYSDYSKTIPVQMVVLGKHVFNHHPLMGASVHNSWPRGFPLQYIKDTSTHGQIALNLTVNVAESIGVLQYCANDNPDIDAIHRLVHPLPMTFASHNSAGPLVAPSHSFVPYNAQATIHTYKALWALLLPYTVPGRVSDIWRGYFAETIFRDLGLSVAFLPPAIVQDRNEHDYLADMQAELDLYFKAGKLLEFLSGWTSRAAQSVPEQMEELWIHLYERGYIEQDDVKMVQLWLSALVEINYQFPAMKHHRIDDTVIMGQFNYEVDNTQILFWHQKWRLWFDRVVVRGPFSTFQIAELKKNGIEAFKGRSDSGYYSPIENLAKTLQSYKDDDSVTGVLYLHDDMMLNVSNVFPVANHSIVATYGENFLKFAMNWDGTFSFVSDVKQTKYSSWEFNKQISWSHMKQCVAGLLRLNEDPRISSLLLRDDDDGSLLCGANGQSDVLYVPTAFADDFSKLASLVVDNEVFLECGLPFIVLQLQQKYNLSLVDVGLCTTWGHKNRGKDTMVEACKFPVSATHPIKLGNGIGFWNQVFDWSTTGATTWKAWKNHGSV